MTHARSVANACDCDTVHIGFPILWYVESRIEDRGVREYGRCLLWAAPSPLRRCSPNTMVGRNAAQMGVRMVGMEFYEAIYRRRTVREFMSREVDFEVICRILEAGNAAPTWNHNRNWSYILLRTPEEKEFAFPEAKKIADAFDADAYLNRPKPYPTTLAQKMYAHAMPRQYTMLTDAPYVVIPVFKCKELYAEWVSKLNPFSTIWCVVENILLAAAAEGLACSMRIPLNEEHDAVKKRLKVPPTYMIPVFIGIGYADATERELEQNVADLQKQLHFGRWR